MTMEQDERALTPEEAGTWSNEMARIVTGTIRELVKAADKHNIDRDSAVAYFSDLFAVMKDISTFAHFESEVG